MGNADKLVEFFHVAGKLKEAYRFSEYNDESLRDSSAEHSWRVSLMAYLIADDLDLDIDNEKMLKIAIIHDIAEAITGDIDALLIYNNKVSREEKEQQELMAIRKISSALPKRQGDEIMRLWNEYETCSSREAKFIKAVDKMETLLYILELNKKAGKKVWDHPEFIATYSDRYVKEFPELSGILKLIKERIKKEYKKAGIPWKREYGL